MRIETLGGLALRGSYIFESGGARSGQIRVVEDQRGETQITFPQQRST